MDTVSEPRPIINEDIARTTQQTTKQDEGKILSSHPIPGAMPPGSNPYKESQQSKSQSRSREQAEKEYIDLAKNILR